MVGGVSCNQTWLGCPGFLSRFSLAATLEAFKTPRYERLDLECNGTLDAADLQNALSLSCMGVLFLDQFTLFFLSFSPVELRGGARIWQWLGSGEYACGPVDMLRGHWTPSTFRRFFFCLPRLSLIDAAVEVRSQMRSKSVGKTPKILGWQDMARPNKHMVNCLMKTRLGFLACVLISVVVSHHSKSFACQTWGSKISIVVIPRPQKFCWFFR